MKKINKHHREYGYWRCVSTYDYRTSSRAGIIWMLMTILTR